MNTHQLEVFLAVAEHLSFAKAARALYISQPAVSQQIRALEAEMDVPLFLRNRHSVALTPAGACLARTAPQLLTSWRACLSDCQCAAQQATPLRIHCVGRVHMRFLPAVLSAFRQRFPFCRVTVERIIPKQIAHALLSDKARLVFTPLDALTDCPSIPYESLWVDQHYCVMPSAHRLAAYATLSAAELHHETILIPSPAYRPAHMINRLAQLQQDCPTLRLVEVVNLENALTQVLAGNGVAIVPGYARPTEDSFRCIPLMPKLPIPFVLAYAQERTAEERCFCETVRQCLARQDAR